MDLARDVLRRLSHGLLAMGLLTVVTSGGASGALAVEPGLEEDDGPAARSFVGTSDFPSDASASAAAIATATDEDLNQDIVTIVAVGDTGLNAHAQPVRARGALKHGKLLPWDFVVKYLKDDIDGDLNFLNLETIVTSRNRLRAENKAFVFRSHPRGIRRLVDLGFNLFSTANNHSMDYAAAGARDTLRHLEAMEDHGLLAYPGLGLDREDAGRPWPVDIKGARIMVSALGIITRRFPYHRAGPRRIGQMSYQSKTDFAEVTGRLASALAAYRILSVHYGWERSVIVERDEFKKLRKIALQDNGIDLVLGHHAHVARPIEITNGKVIIYGLGNFLHHGTANMARFGICGDYGLMAKLHLRKMFGGKLVLRAIEAIPLTQMHRQTRRMEPQKSRERIEVLNYLARSVDNELAGARGVRFTPQRDGSGLYCVAGSKTDPGVIGALCKDWSAPAAPARRLVRRIARACRSLNSNYSSAGKAKRQHRRRHKTKGRKSFFDKVFEF